MRGLRPRERSLELQHGADIRFGAEIGCGLLIAEETGEEGVVEGNCAHCSSLLGLPASCRLEAAESLVPVETSSAGRRDAYALAGFSTGKIVVSAFSSTPRALATKENFLRMPRMGFSIMCQEITATVIAAQMPIA